MLLVPDLYQVDPSTNPPTSTLIYHFTDTLALLGIVELTKDRFYVAGGNINMAKGDFGFGTYGVWEVDLRQAAPAVKKVASFPDSGLLNGMEVLSAETGEILLADSIRGLVWKLNVNTGEVSNFLEVPETKAAPPPARPTAINGLKVRDGYLYWSNTSAQTFCRIAISSAGEPAGETEILARDCLIDDFVFDREGNAWLAQHNLNCVSVIRKDGCVVQVAGKGDSLDIAGATACQFGRGEQDKKVLYCVTTGGMSAPVDGKKEGAKIVAINTSRWS